MPLAAGPAGPVHWTTTGSGAPLVLLHGLGGDVGFWEADAAAWASHFEVVAVDLRGSGATPASPGGHTMRDLADDVAAVLDHRGIPRAHLLGFSMGATSPWSSHSATPDGAPALVVAGDEDALVSLGDANVLAEGIPDTQLVVVSGAGHLLNVEPAGPVPAGGPGVPARTLRRTGVPRPGDRSRLRWPTVATARSRLPGLTRRIRLRSGCHPVRHRPAGARRAGASLPGPGRPGMRRRRWRTRRRRPRLRHGDPHLRRRGGRGRGRPH